MSDLSQAYDPKENESEIYALWEGEGAFNAEAAPGQEAYCIVIPPPNVTAALHLGHAFNNTLQDMLIRYHRMQGLPTLWMPGTDHAGIATQTVVEKRLLETEGKRRTEYDREDFVRRVQDWKDEYEATILGQLKAMGASCDWRRTRFTMDEVCARAVRETFFKLFQDGLIYRGKRLVNWDPKTQTVLADDEVEHEEVQGHFWYLRYPLTRPVTVGGEIVDHVTVATTRPETMLGDTAVAMHPADPRAEALAGASVRLPLVGREIPIITDDHVVMADPDSEDEKARFSTGFLKVTPAHDPDDYQIGLRHELDMINVMAPDGSISDAYGWEDARGSEAEPLLGLDRFEARQRIVAWFKEQGLLEDVRDYVHQVGHSYRSHVPIEPYLSDQWYVAVKKPAAGGSKEEVLEGTDIPKASLAGLALEPLLDGSLRFVPERYAHTYDTWLRNLRDWPISRQLWWGHRIPIWSREGNKDELSAAAVLEALKAQGADAAAQSEAHPEDPALVRVHVNLRDDHAGALAWLEEQGFSRDPDVLDTWFSSALWPFSTLKWPEASPDLDTFFPGNVLCTAREIITLWVSRMVMMGRYCAGAVPFADVCIHAMIQDGEGRKMSKSLGNGVDPLEIIDSYGADALRFTLAGMATQTQDVRMPIEPITLPDGRTVNTSPKFALGRNFCNKLWNATRFTLGHLQEVPAWDESAAREHIADRWILSRLSAAAEEVSRALEAYRFNVVGDTIYHFVWDDFCDWYLEAAKHRLRAGEAVPKAVLAQCLDAILRLLHPVAPFISERLWQSLNGVCPERGVAGKAEPLLIRARWPEFPESWRDTQAEDAFTRIQEVVRELRNVRSHHNVPPSKTVDAIVEGGGDTARLLREHADLWGPLVRLGSVSFREDAPGGLSGAASVVVQGLRVYLLDVVDVEAERSRLSQQRDKLQKGVKGLEGKLSNSNFVSKAPEAVVQKERDRLEELRKELGEVERLLTELA